MATFNWPGFGISSISWTFDQPSQSNQSAWTGTRTVITDPWHGKWSAKVVLATQQGDGAFQAARAFFTGLKGQINTFHLPAVEAPQNANTGVTINSTTGQGQVATTLAGVTTALVAGNMVTVNGQLLSIISVSGLTAGVQVINFEPALRAAATAGTSVETARPYALVYLSDSSFTWDIGQWRRYGLTFNAAEAVGETDGASSSGDTWNAAFSGSGGSSGPTFTGVAVQKDGGTLSQVSTLNLSGAALVIAGSTANISPFVTPQQFGTVDPTGTTDSSAAFLAAIAFLKTQALNAVGQRTASGRLFIPAGHYYLGTTTLDISHNLIIEGEGGQGIGAGGGAATKLRWAANTTGIRIQAANTSGASTVDGPHNDGSFTTLRQLYLAGPAATTDALSSLGLTEGEYHGLHVKGTVFLDTVFVEGFQGDGLYAHTTSGGGAPNEGASNASRAYNCWFRGCRTGASILGADANVWTFVGCQATINRACGVDDQSFLGNTHMGWHTNGNGTYLDNQGTASFPAYVVSNGGNRYCPVQGQETTASTTAPSGTADTSIWLYIGAGGTATGIPAWVSGISLRCAAPYRTNNNNASNQFYNPYEEGNQGFSQFVYPTMIYGGLHGVGSGQVKGTGTYLHNYQGTLAVGGRFGLLDANGFGVYLNYGFPNFFEFYDGTNDFTLTPAGAAGSDMNMTFGNGGGGSIAYQLLGESTANNVGKRRMNFPNGFGNGSLKENVGTAAPTTGAWVQGDRVRNSAPAVGSPKAWVCTVAGTPGTWVSEGNL